MVVDSWSRAAMADGEAVGMMVYGWMPARRVGKALRELIFTSVVLDAWK